MNEARPLSIKMLPLFVLTVLFFSANSILTVLLPLQSEKSGMDHAEIGIMMGAYMFVCMLFRPYAGRMIGRYGPQLIMRLLLIAHAACMILYTFADADAYMPLRAWQGAVTAFFSMTLQAAIVEGLADRDRGQGMTLYSLSSMVPSLFGPVMAMQIWASESLTLYVSILMGLAAAPAGQASPRRISCHLAKQPEHHTAVNCGFSVARFASIHTIRRSTMIGAFFVCYE